MSGCTDFDVESPLPDFPGPDETGVGGMEEGFSTDEALIFGFADEEPRGCE